MKHILLIDDEEQIRKTLKVILEREGYSVSVASNGNQGLRLFREKGADLIITDIIMPDKEGLETIVDIKKEAPRVKIIAISGGGRITSQDLLLWAGKLGVNMTFSKPVDFDEFLKSIAILLAAD